MIDWSEHIRTLARPWPKVTNLFIAICTALESRSSSLLCFFSDALTCYSKQELPCSSFSCPSFPKHTAVWNWQAISLAHYTLSSSENSTWHVVTWAWKVTELRICSWACPCLPFPFPCPDCLHSLFTRSFFQKLQLFVVECFVKVKNPCPLIFGMIFFSQQQISVEEKS